MRKKWMITGILVGLLLAGIAVGCGRTKQESVRDRQEEELILTPKNVENLDLKNAVQGVNEFSLKMGSLLYEEYEGQNFACSPISLWFPLAALLNATEQSKQEEFLQSLGLEGMTMEEVNVAALCILEDIFDGEKSRFQMANAVYVSKKYPLNPDFVQIFTDYYKGSSSELDFGEQSTITEINRFIEEKTNGEIKDMLSGLAPDTKAVLVNAIYFQDKWEKTFDASETRKNTFFGLDGEKEADFMCRSENGQMYYEDDRLQAVLLQYEGGANLYVLLPKEEGAGELYQSLNVEDFERITKEAAKAGGTLLLPKFSIATGNMDLMELLQKLEVPVLDEELTGLIEGPTLEISEALQNVVFRIDEQETTAAAATVIAVNDTEAFIEEPEEEWFTMNCNKPFVFFLTDTTGDGEVQILFGGVMNRPE